MKDGKSFVVAMTCVDFIDSAGIGALISCLRDANSCVGSLELFSFASCVLTLFGLM